jgi:hypothetical protein
MEPNMTLKIYRPDVGTQENAILPDEQREENVPPPQGVPLSAWIVSAVFWLVVLVIIVLCWI